MLQQSFLVDIQNTILFSAIFAFQTLSSLDPQVRNVSSAIFKSTDLPPDSVQVERAGCWQDLNNLVYWLILGHWPFCRRSFPPYFPQFFGHRWFFGCQRSKIMKICIPIKRNKIEVTHRYPKLIYLSGQLSHLPDSLSDAHPSSNWCQFSVHFVIAAADTIDNDQKKRHPN